MAILSEIDSNTSTRRGRMKSTSTASTSASASLALCSDDEDSEDYDTAVGIKPRHSHGRSNRNRNKLCMDDSDDDYNDDDDDPNDGKFKGNADDDEEYLSPLEHENNDDKSNKENRKSKKEKRKDHPDSVVKSKKKNGNGSNKGNVKSAKKKTPNPKARKRRRSSARFLRLSGRFDEDEEGDEYMDSGFGTGIGGVGSQGRGLIGGETEEEQQQKLGEMYRQAIRLNAENKINVGNSWGLNLIDNIDKFLGDEGDDGADTEMDGIGIGNGNSNGSQKTNKNNEEEKQNGRSGETTGIKRVNFTRASCTLDASVKIYSYRVDDVHLSSYKVLANLNRTDGGKEKKKDLFDDGGDAHDDDNYDGEQSNRRQSLMDESRRSGRRTVVETLESNISNINVSKLDRAYDIDPIFHKMSQKFDEGGAKGLLLVNLGVASDGCRIVLDSKEDNITESDNNDPNMDASIGDIDNENADDSSSNINGKLNNQSEDEYIREEGEIDIAEVSSKLQELLLCSPLESIQLVPQLEELRASYDALEEEGFTDKSKCHKINSKRYANDAEEEKAAEKSIQREAFERSRASGLQSTSILAPNLSIFTTASNSHNDDDHSHMDDDDANNQYAPDDYDGGFDDYDDDREDPAFDNFMSTDDNAKKYSSTSFVENEMKDDEFPSYTSSEKASNTTFLDALCTGDALNNGGEYNYFDTTTFDTIVAGNQWAGSSHWKKSERVRTKPKKFTQAEEEEPKRKGQKSRKRKDTKDTKSKSFIDFNSCHKCLDVLLKEKKKTRGKKSQTDPSQYTQAMKQKHSKERNILPQDAEININQFSTLFMRPHATLSGLKSGSKTYRKSVGFLGIDTIPFDDGIDDSYDDGPGFELANMNDDGNFAEMDDYVVKDLEDVRKVDKIRVQHATVAKKVDVKRLKKDLWTELEAKTALTPPINIENIDGCGDRDDVCAGDVDEKNDEVSIKENISDKEISFKNVVENIGVNEKQEDVSLAFYFICVLHLANEKCLKLENGEHGLNDFIISRESE